MSGLRKQREVPVDTQPTDQCIVLPFQPADPKAFDGSGLALHFLIGNVLVLNDSLKEMWFGWRVKKIFPRQNTLQEYCRDARIQLDLGPVSLSQKVRFWIYGSYMADTVSIILFDAQSPRKRAPSIQLPISVDDGLIEFRSQFIQWLDSSELAMAQAQTQSALWSETIDRKGLDAVGRALEDFYIYSSYGGDVPLDLPPFEKAAAVAPDSFMAQDLYGWALYRNKNYRMAKIAFLKSLRVNPAGVGAMSGLMWCGVYARDLEEAIFWSGRKADVCGQDVVAAREAGRRRYEKANR